jgi:DHA1 family tetracycline resistance protein-like MFS transporter
VSQEQTKQSNILFPIYLAYFLSHLGISLFVPVLGPLLLNPDFQFFHFSTSLGVKSFILGFVFTCYPLARFISSPFIGDLADFYGRKKTLLFCLFGQSIGFFITALSITWHSIWFLILGRLVTGVFAGNASVCITAVADLSPDEKVRSKRFGLIALSAGLSFIVGVVIASLLSSEVCSFGSFSLPAWIMVFFSTLNYVLVNKYFTETFTLIKQVHFSIKKSFQNVVIALSDPKLNMLYAFYLLYTCSLRFLVLYLPAILVTFYSFSQLDIGIAFTFFGFLWAFGSTVVNRLFIRKIKPFMLIYFASVLIIVSYLLLTFFKTAFIFWLAVPSLYILYAFTWPNIRTEISNNATSEVQGKVVGLSVSMIALGEMIASLLGGLVFPFGAHALFFQALVIISLGFAFLYNYKKKYVETIDSN